MTSQKFNRLGWYERVGQIAKVDAGDKLFWRHFANQLPHRFAVYPRPQIPYRINDGRRCEMNDTFLGTHPTQLTIARQPTVHLPRLGHQQFKRLTNEQRHQ